MGLGNIFIVAFGRLFDGDKRTLKGICLESCHANGAPVVQEHEKKPEEDAHRSGK